MNTLEKVINPEQMQPQSDFRKLRGIFKGKFTTDEIMGLTRKRLK